MRVNLSYGKGHLPINLSDDWEVTVVRKPKMNIHNDPAAAVEQALRVPVGCDKFVKPNGPNTSVCILVCDILGLCQMELFCQCWLDTLLKSVLTQKILLSL